MCFIDVVSTTQSIKDIGISSDKASIISHQKIPLVNVLGGEV